MRLACYIKTFRFPLVFPIGKNRIYHKATTIGHQFCDTGASSTTIPVGYRISYFQDIFAFFFFFFFFVSFPCLFFGEARNRHTGNVLGEGH